MESCKKDSYHPNNLQEAIEDLNRRMRTVEEFMESQQRQQGPNIPSTSTRMTRGSPYLPQVIPNGTGSAQAQSHVADGRENRGDFVGPIRNRNRYSRTYQCLFCDSSFGLMQVLVNHLLSQHQEELHSLNWCGYLENGANGFQPLSSASTYQPPAYTAPPGNPQPSLPSFNQFLLNLEIKNTGTCFPPHPPFCSGNAPPNPFVAPEVNILRNQTGLIHGFDAHNIQPNPFLPGASPLRQLNFNSLQQRAIQATQTTYTDFVDPDFFSSFFQIFFSEFSKLV